MGKRFNSYRDESRGNWGKTLEDGVVLSDENLKIGAIFRIADALESILSLARCGNLQSFIINCGRYAREIERKERAKRLKASKKRSKTNA